MESQRTTCAASSERSREYPKTLGRKKGVIGQSSRKLTFQAYHLKAHSLSYKMLYFDSKSWPSYVNLNDRRYRNFIRCNWPFKGSHTMYNGEILCGNTKAQV